MRAWTRISAILLICAALTGCFTANGSLYAGVTPLHPFHGGAVLTHDHDGKPGHLALRQQENGSYRFTISDPGDDFGEGYLLRFFSLPGAPPDILIFEAVELCKPHKVCQPATSVTPRFYGLVRVTAHGAAMSSPDCPKDSPAAKLPSVTLNSFSTCTFSDRGVLEKSLMAVGRTDWKPDAVYSYY